jgi:glycosyltransferase involved in cell wall biosynthesis
MRIAMISTPFVAVPPPRYGGTELVVSELVDGLSAAGHDVTLFATGDSGARCERRALYPRAVWPPDPYAELDHAAWAVGEVIADGGFEVVHAHVAAALPFVRFLHAPLACTVHHAHDARLSSLYRGARAHLVAISARQRALAPEIDGARVIHHGLSPSRYPPGDGAGGYAVFLGRLSREKGAHHAIDAARAVGMPVRLAGRPHAGDERYWRREVAPRLRGSSALALGEVGGARKLELLGAAAALLFPVEWEEPFGLVMIEAMLCGTPVLAFPRGAVAEVVEPGVTGYLCHGVADMARRLGAIASFDRRACRARAVERWSARRMVDEHVQLYEQLTSWSALHARLTASLA